MNTDQFEVIIIGGSYAGLSAAMALGRSLRNVLVIDDDKSCNKKAPQSHNLITHDGEEPDAIREAAKQQVLAYNTVSFLKDKAVSASKIDIGYQITTEEGRNISARKLLFTTGMYDIMPGIPGFSDCWGISVLHCPYCHGYEVRSQKWGVLANGEEGYTYAKMLSHWTNDLTVFTNGAASFTDEQQQKLEKKGIQMITKPVQALVHENGALKELLLEDGSRYALKALFARTQMKQHCDIPQEIGCELLESGYIKVNHFCETTVEHVFAAGDNTSMFRSVAEAIATGNKAGAMINRELVFEDFG